MKKIALIASLLISATVFAQPPLKDTLRVALPIKQPKADTVRVPYLVVEATDTIPAMILYCGKEPNVKYTSGYTLMKGVKDQSGKFIVEPQPVGWLDKKKQPLTSKVLMWYYDDKRKEVKP